ncbi:MAG: leucyl aminopeptidase family protein [Thermoprotei archaeon]|jgi:leucyl aminopeptidase
MKLAPKLIDVVSVPKGVLVEATHEGEGEKKEIKFKFSLDEKKIVGTFGDELKWGSRLVKFLRSNSITEASVVLNGLNAEKVAIGARLACYRFKKYLTSSEDKEITIHIVGKEHEAEVNTANTVCEAVELARDLGNEPAISVPPLTFAQVAKEKLRGLPVEVEVIESDKLLKDGFGGIMAVGKGSSNPPALLVMKYNGGQGKPIVLVGKGVVFDSGGLNLKVGGGIRGMYMDKSGAADVVGAVYGAAKLKINKNVIGIAPLVENIPSGSAIRPGDIIRMYSGKTVEVANTDAEGRLILADAISYGKTFDPQEIVDLATLTGAQVVALGSKVAAVMGNDDKLISSLIESGKRTGELLWQLPLFDLYEDLVKGERSDIKNISDTGEAGSIVGGTFLKYFAEGTPWAHIDLAGPAMLNSEWEWMNKGATGFGVRLLLDHLKGRMVFIRGLP